MSHERGGLPIAPAEDDATRPAEQPPETEEERQRVIRPWVEQGTPEQQHASAVKTVSMLEELRALRAKTDLAEDDKLRREKLEGSERSLRKNLHDLGVTLTETDAGIVAQRNGVQLEIPSATERKSAERHDANGERRQRRIRTPKELAADLIRRNDELVRLRALPNPSDTDTKRIASLERSVDILKRQVTANVPPGTPSTDAVPKPTEEQAPKAGKNNKNGAVKQQGGKFDVGDIDNAYDAGLAKARADYLRTHPRPTQSSQPDVNQAAEEKMPPTGDRATPEDVPAVSPTAESAPAVSPVPETATEPAPVVPPTPEPRSRIEVGIVNIEQKIEEVAKFRAEQRLQAELRGEHDKNYYRSERWWVRGLDKMLDAIPTVRKAVRHMGEEGYRQRYIALERKRIIENLRSANPAAATKGEVALTSPETRAIVDRFLTDAQGVIETQKGEKKESAAEAEVQTAVRTMMDEYVQGNLTRDQFQDKRDALVELLQTSHGTVLDADKTKTIDNLLDVAEELRAAALHGEKISVMDFEIDVKLGRARSAIEDEANLRAYDKLVQKIQKTPVLNLISPATLGFVTSITTNVLLGKFTQMGLMAAGATSLGAGTAVAGAFAGLRRGMEVKRDSSYVRRGHAVGLEVPAGAKKLEKMNEFVYEQASVADLTTNIEGAMTAMQQEADPAQFGGRIDALIAQIAEADARQDMGFQLHHDLLRYSDPQKIEQERLQFLKTSAQAKVALRQYVDARRGQNGIPADMDQALQKARTDQEEAIRSNMQEVDKKFGHFRNVEVAKAVGYGAVTGLVVGAVAQEAFAHVFHPHGTNTDTAIDHLAKKIFGHHDHLGPDHAQVVDGAKWNLPPGVHAEHVPGHPNMMTLVDDHGRTLHEALPVNPDGSLIDTAQHDLIRDGWMANGSTVEGTGTVPTDEWVKHHPGLTFIDRRDWMDQNTPHLPDLNELKLWWGGLHGTGIDAHGNFLFNIGKMTEHGSFHGGITENVKQLLHSGDLRMHCAISQGTQKFVFEFPIDEHGNAMIPKDSEAAKMLFRVEGGHAKYLGRFAEAVRVFHNKDGSLMKGPDGGIVSRMFATHEGAGLEKIAGAPQKVVDFLQPKPWELPPTIPLSRRKAMEEWSPPMEPGYDYEQDQPPSVVEPGYEYEHDQRRAVVEPGYDYGSGRLSIPYDQPVSVGYETADGKPYDQTMHEQRRPNETVDRSLRSMRTYLEHNTDRQLLEKLNTQIGMPMSEHTRMSVVLPCYRESENIYRTLDGWTTQQREIQPEEVELIVFVNTPNKAEQLDRATIDEVQRFQHDHPEYKIHLVTHQFEFSGKAKMGTIYKTPADLVLMRNLQRLERGISKDVVDSHLMRTGGADAVERNPRFLRSTVDFLVAHPEVEQLRSQSAYPEDVRERFPLFNAVVSFSHSLNALYTRGNSNVGLGTYRSRIYAAAGGFQPDVAIREEIALSQSIRRAVGNRGEQAIKKILVKNAIDNPRRELFSMIKRLGIRNAYRNFGNTKLEKELRDFDWESLTKRKHLPRQVEKITALTAENATREFGIAFEQFQRYVIPSSDTFRRVLRGEGIGETSPSLHPEQRLLLHSKAVTDAIESLRKKRETEKNVSLSTIEARILAATMSMQMFDRVFRISLGLHRGSDYIYTGELGAQHLQISKKGVEKIAQLAKIKWEKFPGTWQED